MKTSEMIAMLEKNPKFRFTNGIKIGHIYDDGGTVVSNTVGFVYDKACWIKPDGKAFDLFIINKATIKTDWQLVREPVPGWEAIKALSEGKSIEWHSDNDREILCFSKNDKPEWAVNLNIFFTGKWYINE